MWELDHKEDRAPKNWCFQTVVLEKTLESPLDCKEIKPVYPKGNQPWIFTGMTDVEVEALVLWSPDVKIHLTGKDPDAGNDWGQEEKGAAEDEMVGWHHWLTGHESEQTLGDSEDREAWCATALGSQRVRHNRAAEQQTSSLFEVWRLKVRQTSPQGKPRVKWTHSRVKNYNEVRHLKKEVLL